MLNIYQEYVRNHQYSLQVLASCKQNRDFDKLLKQYESNAACEGRMLETFLTYPMFQIPRYIITLHELLAHTPHEHVERKSLDFAKSKLEELSKMMHDEVSNTENIRKNLAIERMIVEGCDILLDTSQTFVRQGSLIQLPSVERGKLCKVRLGTLSLRKEGERQCFLFTKHLLICNRTSSGKLHLLKQGGTLSLIECTLFEELDTNDEDYNAAGQGFSHLEFKLLVEPPDGPSFAVVLLAPSRQEKAAWTSDISQCIDNIRCNGLMTSVFEENSKVTVPHMLKSDTRLHNDDVDICFSKTLNSCKVPQIRYASVDRLLERLTDLRFLSIDFLNTFLHTYRIFTTAAVVMDKLNDIYKKPFTSIPVRSLELFFATNQGPWGNELQNNKSPRLTRKFSTPPPLSIPSRTSSPMHCRKLSLSSPVSGAKAMALDLSASSLMVSSPTSTYNSMISSPPPNCTKAPLDLSKGPSSPELGPTTPEEGGELPRIDTFCGKLRRSVRRNFLESLSFDKFIPETPTSVDLGDVSLCSLPSTPSSTPRHPHYRQPGGFTSPEKSYDKEFLIRRAVTNRVLNVLRHWVSKHSQGTGGNWATVGRKRRGRRRVHRQREKRKGKSVGLRIGTLNVGTMTGKGRELADMMERRKVDILCVQETRWKGSKARSIGAGFKLFYYGVDSKRNGVGVVLKEEFVRNVLEVKRVSDRVMSLKLEIEGVMLNVVSGYAPQVGCELEEKERFWSELDEVMESIPIGERVVIGADFNGYVGEGNRGDEEVMGKFGVKERNLEGQMVVDFAKRMDMAVVNTYFQKREEHRVTYKSGGRRTQVDYILCRRGNLKEISDYKVVVGESVARQHRMVVCRMTLMVCKKKRSKIEIEKKTKWWKLKKEECCEEFRQKLRQALGGQVVLPDDWETTAEVIRETGRKVLGVSSGRRKEYKQTWWWNEEVQDSIQRKRLAKKKWDMDRTEENRQEYRSYSTE
ncbi:hypothetical protein QTP70_003136 [Hemibagrus guttatus]|uniref:Ras-specific guanine nucleotide-releasing factor 2 n=1 Tax=Hemibagrus guttatus TaxID=175788 RepID=A0AAE0QJ52_9TELE|nr:hypothetical protein QTP70_003136 [Hemibagrus guttatus]